MTDPEPLSGLVGRVEEIRHHRPSVEAIGPDDYEDPDLDRLRREGLDRLRTERWEQVIPPVFVEATLDDVYRLHGPNPAAVLDRWSKNADGRNLVILGPVGTGKSHAAVATVRAAHFSGLSVRFFPVVELLDLLRPGAEENRIYDALVDVDRLILDDLGAEKASEWTTERLYALINRRWLERRPTVATSNLTADALRAALGERILSRLGGGAVSLVLAGDDQRRTQTKENPK